MREGGTNTVQVSAPQGVTDPNGHKPTAFLGATPSGSKAFFTSCEKLTADSTAVSDPANPNRCDQSTEGSDLYSYDTSTGDLADLTVDSNRRPHRRRRPGRARRLRRRRLRLLRRQRRPRPGRLRRRLPPDNAGELAGSCSLYLSHAATVTFVARLNSTARTERATLRSTPRTARRSQHKTSRVTAQGTLVFTADGSAPGLTGYDNQPAAASD